MQKPKKSTGSRGAATYKRWMESIGVPIHQGHHVEDLRTAELAWWEDRQANAAFLYLKGMELGFTGDLQDRGFKFNNPNAANTCGCGTSFSV